MALKLKKKKNIKKARKKLLNITGGGDKAIKKVVKQTLFKKKGRR